jgi:hypothetical protein
MNKLKHRRVGLQGVKKLEGRHQERVVQMGRDSARCSVLSAQWASFFLPGALLGVRLTCLDAGGRVPGGTEGKRQEARGSSDSARAGERGGAGEALISLQLATAGSWEVLLRMPCGRVGV